MLFDVFSKLKKIIFIFIIFLSSQYAFGIEHVDTDPVFQVPIHINELGSVQNETLLMVHGLGQNASKDWDPIASTLAKKYHIILLDLPGFGKSGTTDTQRFTPENYASFLSWVVHKYSKTKVTVVGHSLGGAIALYFANKFKDQVDKMVLIDVAGIVHKASFVKYLSQIHPSYLQKVQKYDLLKRAAESINSISGKVLEFADDFSLLADIVMENARLRETLARDNAMAKAAMGLIETNFTETINSIETPTLIIWGENDLVSSLRVGELLNGHLKNSYLKKIPQVGHVPMKEKPKIVTQTILTWLEKPEFSAKVDSKSTDQKYICKNLKNKTIQESYEEMSFENCNNITLKNVSTRLVQMKNSNLNLINVTIDSAETAIISADSDMMATNLIMNSKTAMRIENSKFDIAGAKIKATEKLIDATGENLIYWSVSQIESPVNSTKTLHERTRY